VTKRRPDPTATPSDSPSGITIARARMILWICLTLLVLSAISFNISILIITMLPNFKESKIDNVVNVYTVYTVSAFITFLLLYLVVFLLIMKRLKNFYSKFYQREKTQVRNHRLII